MRILVTGSNGLLGQKLVKLISTSPDYLIATAKSSLVLDLPQGEFHLLDVTVAESVENVIAESKPEVIIHTAAMTQVDECEVEHEKCWLNNVQAVENIVKACEQFSIRLIHLSTDFIFDGTHCPLDENEKPNPLSYYGKSKLAAEEIIQKSKIEWAILRTVLVYGVTKDMTRSNIVLWVKKSLEEGKTIQVVNDQWRTPTLAEDLAQGCYLAATKKAKGIYNVCGEKIMTPYGIAIATATFFKLDTSLIKETDSTKFKQRAVRPQKSALLITKAKKELGYQPRSFSEGLKMVQQLLEGF